jgi:signal transduction histidine kinase
MSFSRVNIAIMALIGGAALVLSVVSYQYSTAASAQILSMAAEDIRSNTKIQAHDLSNVLVNKLSAITNNLRTVSQSPAYVDASQVETGKMILGGLQDSTKDLTEVYFWLDKDGRVVWTSNTDTAAQAGADRSFREYFIGPRDSGDVYYTTAIISVDGVPRIHVAAPLYDSAGQFNGVLATGIRLEVLGKYLESQISPDYAGSVGMMDRNGVVLYSENLELIGKDIFGDEVQSQIPADLKGPFNDFLRRSLAGGSGVEDLSYQGRTGSLAYQTTSIDGKDVGVIYVTAEHAFAGDVLALVGQQQAFTAVTVGVIGAIAAGIALLVLSWNRQLQSLVSAKTKELELANADLKAKSTDLEGALQSVEHSKTQLVKANELLTAHDKIQTEFVNIAAHELRTPVQPLLGVVETMQIVMKENGDQRIVVSKEEVDMLARNAKRLERLTQNILDVTRIENNKLMLENENFDIVQKIMNVVRDTMESEAEVSSKSERETVYQWHRSKGSSEVTVRFMAPRDPVILSGDKTRMFEVVSNLLNNGLKFTRKGIIEIYLQIKDNEIQVQIKDSGKGVDPEILPRLFTKFATKSESGTGLGLYVSKNIVEAHSGKIWAENNHGEPGASFFFTLPLTSHKQSTKIRNDPQQD